MAVISSSPRKEEEANEVEYLKREKKDDQKRSSSAGSAASLFKTRSSVRSSSITSPSTQSLRSRRKSLGSASFSDDNTTNGLHSPGLSVSSSMTNYSYADDSVKANDGVQVPSTFKSDKSSPISPFTNPRKAPTPPDAGPLGLGLMLNIDQTEDKESLPPSPVAKPPFHRQDSLTDPDLMDGKSESCHTDPTLFHHKERPTSVPFSPPSDHVAEFHFSQNREQVFTGIDEEDEFMVALGKLESHHDLEHSLSLGWDPRGRLGIPISLVNAQDDSSDPTELPLDSPSPNSSPRLANKDRFSIRGDNPSKLQPNSFAPYRTLGNDHSPVRRSSDQDKMTDDDKDALHFLQIYSNA